MSFQVSALPLALFDELFTLDDGALAARGARRMIATEKPGFPCRISLEDAEPGEPVVLLPFSHQPADSPYRASGPIFVRERAVEASLAPGDVPKLLRSRVLSVRAYDRDDLMIDADVVDGREVEPLIARFFENSAVQYIHVHFARPGCFACRVDRTD